jgi:hypothetical protein
MAMLISIGGSTPRLGRLPHAFMAPDPMTGLEILVQVLMHLWESERLVLQPGALGTLDPDFQRPRGLQPAPAAAITVLLLRLSPPPADLDDESNLLTAMTSFESNETLAARSRDARPLLCRWRAVYSSRLSVAIGCRPSALALLMTSVTQTMRTRFRKPSAGHWQQQAGVQPWVAGIVRSNCSLAVIGCHLQ